MRWWFIRFVLDQHIGFHSASSLKQQSAHRYVAPLGHIILILSLPLCSVSSMLVLSGKEINTNFKFFGLTRPGLETTIYCPLDGYFNHYATNSVLLRINIVLYVCFSHIEKSTFGNSDGLSSGQCFIYCQTWHSPRWSSHPHEVVTCI